VPEIDLDRILTAAVTAGSVIMDIYERDFEVDLKADQSPLTEADRQANAVIMEALSTHYPHIPVISEENKEVTYAERSEWDQFWLVDPLDGTKEFIKKNGEFTVNIALIKKGLPVAGIVYRPVERISYSAESGSGAFRTLIGGEAQRINNDKHYLDQEQVSVVASRSHITPEVKDFVGKLKELGKEVDLISVGSSLKLCLVAEGSANVYPRFGPTMEWDTGAAHAVVLESGRDVISHETGESLIYNKPSLLNPWFIVE
jgi:3'(2'), 5'-bisphosphate nucleotidase